MMNVDRSNNCPYLGCNKAYTSKTSLRFHVKRNHQDGDDLKPDMEIVVKEPLKFRRGVNLNNVFKKDHICKLKSKLGVGLSCSTEDYSNSIASDEIYENSYESGTVIDDQKTEICLEDEQKKFALQDCKEDNVNCGEICVKKVKTEQN